MLLPSYPDQFVLPLWRGYSFEVDATLVRTEMETGYRRQRRKNQSMPHLFNVTFRMKQEELGDWQRWVNLYGYDWFEMSVNDMYSSELGSTCSIQEVRLVNDLQISMRHAGWFDVSTQMEISPRSYGRPGVPTDPVHDWIISGTPVTPSVDIYIAGDPANVPFDMVNPGSPARPAALV